MNKNIDRYWHEESTLVFKSKDEKVVIGRYDGTELVDMDDETVTLADEWKFKLDPSMIEEEESEKEATEETREEEREEEKEETGEEEREETGEETTEETNEEREETREETNEEREETREETIMKQMTNQMKKQEESNEETREDELREELIESRKELFEEIIEKSCLNEDVLKDGESEFNKLVENVLKMYKELVISNKDKEENNVFLKDRISTLEEELLDVTQKYNKLNDKFSFLKQHL
jgi:hypothetical protein